MGFITTYVILSILGLFASSVIKKYKKNHKGISAYYTVLAISILLILDILIYFGALDILWNIISTNIWWINIDCGRDFMWNSFLWTSLDFGIDYTNVGLNSLALILFVSYIPWFTYAKNWSRMLFGNKPYQKGFWWILTPVKKPKDYKKKKKNQES